MSRISSEFSNPWIPTVTDAPEAYDGFGTRTVGNLGGAYATARGMVRLVLTPGRHVEWQRGRYASGLHLAMEPAEFNRLDAGTIDRFYRDKKTLYGEVA